MRNNERTETGLDLTLMDIDDAHSDYMRWAGIRVAGKTWLICTEGVAYETTNYDTDKCVQYFGLTQDQITAQLDAVAYGYVAPEDFVRVFGSRLESNLAQFVWTVKQAEKEA